MIFTSWKWIKIKNQDGYDKNKMCAMFKFKEYIIALFKMFIVVQLLKTLFKLVNI